MRAAQRTGRKSTSDGTVRSPSRGLLPLLRLPSRPSLQSSLSWPSFPRTFFSEARNAAISFSMSSYFGREENRTSVALFLSPRERLRGGPFSGDRFFWRHRENRTSIHCKKENRGLILPSCWMAQAANSGAAKSMAPLQARRDTRWRPNS